MQVFIIGSPLDTAKNLDRRRLNKQIIECQQILNAIDGKTKSWSNHPCTIQYKKYKEWLIAYMHCLKAFYNKDIHKARIWNLYASDNTPNFHTSAYFDNMKRRLYTKDNEYYKQWESLGKSYENWYWVNNKWKIYKQTK